MKKLLMLLAAVALATTGLTFNTSIVELKLPKSNKIVVKLMFQNGSIADPAGKEGLTDFTAELMVGGGTQDMSYSEIQNKIYPMASEMGVQVDKEVTTFTFEVHRDFADAFYPILRGIILTPAFSDEDFERIKTQQQNYVDKSIRASSDEVYSKKALENLLFRGTPYQHMTQGKSASVKNITVDDVKAHYKNAFTKDNVMIGIAGNYSADFLTRLKEDINQLPDTKPNLPDPPKANVPNGIEVEIVSKPNTLGSAVFTGYPLAITRADDDFAALMVANSYLGEHRKSYGVLYEKIRSTRSMNYGDYSYIEWYENGHRYQLPPPNVPRSSNYFAIWLRPVQIAAGLKQQYPELKGIKIGHAHFALRLAIRELDTLIKKGMTQEDFERTRTFLRSYINLYIQTPASQLGFLMDSKVYGRQNYIQELDKALEKLTLDEVNQAVKKYLQAESMFVTIITDESEAAPLSKSLKTNAPSPMSYSNVVREGLPEEVLAEDKKVEVYPLNVTSVKIIPSGKTFE